MSSPLVIVAGSDHEITLTRMTINTKSPTGSGRGIDLYPEGQGSADDASDGVKFNELEVAARDR
jgi:hypothetical protein